MGAMFEQQFVEQLMVAFTPRTKELIKQVIAAETATPIELRPSDL